MNHWRIEKEGKFGIRWTDRFMNTVIKIGPRIKSLWNNERFKTVLLIYSDDV